MQKLQHKLKKLLIYYILLFIGIIIILKIIWNKFICGRLPKNIPINLTEYGFWVFCYICLIYFIISLTIIISLLGLNTSKLGNNPKVKEFIDQLYTPFTILDHALKYNKYIKNKYLIFMDKILYYTNTLKKKHYLFIILVFQIFPRLFLIIFLIRDVFYFHKLEIFYKVILISLIILIFRYFKYMFKDIKEYYINELENTYENIMLWDQSYNDYNENDDWELNENNKYHDQEIPVREYLEFKIKQTLYGFSEVSYTETPFSYEHIYEDYKKNNNIPKETSLKKADHQVLDSKYYILSKIVIQAGVIHEKFSLFQNEKIILYLRLLISLTYFTCWFYVLIISYYSNPIELEMFKYFLQNLTDNIAKIEDPFLHDIFIKENILQEKSLEDTITVESHE